MDLMVDVGDLEDEVTAVAASALIEDYFEVNDSTIEILNFSPDKSLVDPFCVTEPGVFIFQLSVNYNFEESGGPFANLATELLINDVPVARSVQIDSAKPQNVVLFYEGEVSADTSITVLARASS